jgi:hypothetical protein
MKNLLLIFLLSFKLTSSAICILIDDGGDWSSSASWDCGYIPANAGDTMRIPANMTVAIDLNSPTYVNMRIEVYGTMLFSNGRKINLDNDGVVVIYAGGTLTGGNSGSRLNIGGTTWWSGTDPPLIGPLTVSNSGVLPVELIEFNAIVNEDIVEISWTTASEINNDYFLIEKSQDALEWVTAIETKGADNSVNMINYFEIDSNPLRGLSYYRLTQVDFNGERETFNIIPVEYAPDGDGVMNIYPNPLKRGDCINILFKDVNCVGKQEILVVLRDIRGKEVYSKIEVIDCREGLIAIDRTNNLSAGTYLVVATSKNILYSKKITIE